MKRSGILELERRIDEYRTTHHDHWKTAGGETHELFCYRGISTKEGINHRTFRKDAWDDILADANLGGKYPLLDEYTQNKYIDDPGGAILVYPDGTPDTRPVTMAARTAAATAAGRRPED